MKTITMIAYNRPDYTKTTLQALQQCYGIEEYKLKAFIEPGCNQVVQLFKNWKICPIEININPKKLGILENTKQAFQEGFKDSDFIIHIEDDTVPAKDTLKLMEHCNPLYREDPKVFNVSGYSRYTPVPSVYYELQVRSWYHPWIVGLWKNKTSSIYDLLQNTNNYGPTVLSYVQKNKLYEVFPTYSRSLNIGLLGDKVINPYWQYKQQRSRYWAADLPQGQFFERPRALTTLYPPVELQTNHIKQD